MVGWARFAVCRKGEKPEVVVAAVGSIASIFKRILISIFDCISRSVVRAWKHKEGDDRLCTNRFELIDVNLKARLARQQLSV